MFLYSEPVPPISVPNRQKTIKLLSGQEWLCSSLLKELLGSVVDMVGLVAGAEEWEEWTEEQKEVEGGAKMSEKEERWLWSMLDECDAEQVKEEKITANKMKRKVGLARIKMKAGKDQPSMRDMLSKGPARSGKNQSPKTLNASGTSQERSSINMLTGSESNIIL